MNLEDKLYTSTEVAEILGVSLRSIYRYLEEGRLYAAVKTATGRHRFTKQNILDFLHPSSNNNVSQKVSNSHISHQVELQQNAYKYKDEDGDGDENEIDYSKISAFEEEVSKDFTAKENLQESSQSTDDDYEEPVDWLKRFREAAELHRQQEAMRQQVSQESGFSKVAEDAEDVNVHTSYHSIYPQTESVVEEEAPVAPSKSYRYYRSGVGGLKDIAQGLDKSAKKSGVDYAFTLNAGLSLHKPIKPFSLLHSYVRPKDLELFERMLELSPADERSAQLCLIVTDENNIYSNKKEMHGLNVVSDLQLKQDLHDHNLDDLARELE